MATRFRFFEKTVDRSVYQNMVKAEEYQDLRVCLVKMQTDRGIDLEDACMTAESCIAAVLTRESVCEQLSLDAAKVVNDLLEDISQDERRELILHTLFFGLTVYQDAEMVQLISSGASLEDLFWAYHNENDGLKSIEELEQDVRNAVAQYHLSPEVMRSFATQVKKVKSSSEYMATAAALGEGGINFKSILTMETYLDNRGTMTMMEAANKACYEADVEAVGDSVGRRMMTRKTAKKVLIIAGIAVAVVAVGFAVYYTGSGMALAKSAAAATDLVIPIPEVFSGIAGSSVLVLQSAEGIRSSLQPLIEAAKSRKFISIALIAMGAAVTALSQKTANVIGSFLKGFSCHLETEPAAVGLESIAEELDMDMVEAPAENPFFAHTSVYETGEEIQHQQVPVFG